ncbi:MAG: hypothetical protein QOD06_1737 [Candidatus Binatota bacterium]|nr:hypothetical protein [Candidatus Binatota bacterium]
MKKTVRLLISCEHASHSIPPRFQSLGVSPEALISHSSWDPGAGDLAKEVAGAFGIFPFLGGYSRLLVDLNRSSDNPEVIPEISYGLAVPGNRALSVGDRLERLRRYYTPYRSAVRKAAVEATAAGDVCMHVAIHSFTPEYASQVREGRLGVLFDAASELEAKVADEMLASLRAESLDARPNYPYDGAEDSLTTTLRTELSAQGYVGVQVELSQYDIDSAPGILRYSEPVERAVRRAILAV